MTLTSLFKNQFVWTSFALVLIATVNVSLTHAEEPPSSEILELEPVIVEATRIDDRPGFVKFFGRHDTWSYVSLPGYEILSRCDTEQTIAVARHVGDSLVLDKELIPAAYLPTLAVPMSFIMFDQEPSKAMEALIPNSFEVVDSPSFGIYHNRFDVAAGGADTSDSDTHCAVQNRGGLGWAWAGGGLGRGPIPTGLIFQISRCLPALPSWYLFGLIGPSGLFRLATGKNHLVLAEATWVSEAETNRMLDQASRTKIPPKLPPIEELFRQGNDSFGNSTTNWPTPTWMAEAALFLRWGLYSDIGHRKAFEKFIERSRREPVTEIMFRDCFGIGYPEMQLRLSRYLIEGARKPVLIDYTSFTHEKYRYDPEKSSFTNLSCRAATRAEIARLLGDWERMEGNANRIANPNLSRLFLKRAGKTLHQSFDEGERDPRFLAVLGLYEFDTGSEAAARNALQAATDAKVDRPAAYVALAQLNLEDAQKRPASLDGAFSRQQTASILLPLFTIRKTTRLSAKGYSLVADAWFHCTEKPSLLNLGILQEGIQLYPFDSTLILSSIKTYAKAGYLSEANALIIQKLHYVDDATSKQILVIQTSLASIKGAPNQ